MFPRRRPGPDASVSGSPRRNGAPPQALGSRVRRDGATPRTRRRQEPSRGSRNGRHRPSADSKTEMPIDFRALRDTYATWQILDPSGRVASGPATPNGAHEPATDRPLREGRRSRGRCTRRHPVLSPTSSALGGVWTKRWTTKSRSPSVTRGSAVDALATNSNRRRGDSGRRCLASPRVSRVVAADFGRGVQRRSADAANDGLDVMAVGVQDERRVVGGAIVGS